MQIDFQIFDPNGFWFCQLKEQGLPNTILKVTRSHLVRCIFFFFSSVSVNEVSVSRLLQGQCTGGLPTRGRRKPLHSPPRPCLVVSQIKKTNNNKLQQHNWIIVRRVGFSTFSSGPGTDLFFSSPVHGIHLTIPVIDHVIERVMAANGKL